MQVPFRVGHHLAVRHQRQCADPHAIVKAQWRADDGGQPVSDACILQGSEASIVGVHCDFVCDRAFVSGERELGKDDKAHMPGRGFVQEGQMPADVSSHIAGGGNGLGGGYGERL
ncbi:hypothetical protein MAFF301069_27200 [Ralstonia pseudosolanacearum]|nr:hypothetical protein MAFF211471_28830 [Ralstonia solanacearum]BEU52674.1 hypothetical protein MAFF211520_29660 [Ralstonia pseudosolanacearum]BCN00355.1 hypothetical protein RPSA_28910 [Ralstonia solanacearum]BEU57921.1 hypothetical protein MAFF211521_29740 [Ralstonia pseudosolanacearum]BEU61402.1 hypothetical protein MAFF301524_12020 [Ralstonia pseudosolanacearum]